MAKAKTQKPPKDAPEAEAEVEGVDGEAAPAEGAKKTPPIKLIVIAAAAGALVLGGGAVTAMLMLGGGKAEAHKSPAKKKAPPRKDADAKKDGLNPISQGPDGVVFYTLPDMVVNIQSPDGRPTYLKLKLTLETASQDDAEAITPEQPRLNDMFQGFLRELRPDDLSGSEGSYELRQEIQRRVNLVIAPAKVNAVLIQEMLIQ